MLLFPSFDQHHPHRKVAELCLVTAFSIVRHVNNCINVVCVSRPISISTFRWHPCSDDTFLLYKNCFHFALRFWLWLTQHFVHSQWNVLKRFWCLVAGLVLNKLWLLELAAEGDRRITIEGDVELEISPLRSYYIRCQTNRFYIDIES